MLGNNKLRIIVLVAFMLRVILGIPLIDDMDKMLVNDSPSYIKVAQNLYEGNGYSNCPSEPYYKDVLRTPTYPYIISIAKHLTTDVRIVFLIQVIIDLLTLILIFRIGSYLVSEVVGLIAALFYALSIISVVMCTKILAETIFVFLIVLSFYALAVKQKHFLAGISLGLAVLCKPIGLYIIVVYILYVLWKRVRLGRILLFTIPFVLLIGGWMFRNYKITQVPTISSISSYSLFAYNANMVLSYKQDVPESVLRETRIAEVYKETKGELGDYSGEYDYIEKFGALGKEAILNNLALYTFLHLKNSVNSLIPGVHYVLELFGKTKGKRGTMDILRKEGVWSASKFYFKGRWGSVLMLMPWVLCWIAMLLSAFGGIIKVVLNRKWEMIMLLILPGLYFLFISGPSAEPRFGALIAPYFCLLAGYYLGGLDSIKRFYNSSSIISQS